jgi:glutathione S-transferase
MLEDMIEGETFFLGERPTLADALLIGVARWLDFHEVADKRRWPKLATLRQRLETDPAVIYATGLENGELSRGSVSCAGHVELTEVIERFGK